MAISQKAQLDELTLYHQVYDRLGIELRKPDLTVYLEADTSVLMKRIKSRSIRYEKAIPKEYLKRLNEAYASHFYDYKERALLVVNTSEIDIVGNEADLTDLLEQIDELKTGRKHYAPLRSR